MHRAQARRQCRDKGAAPDTKNGRQEGPQEGPATKLPRDLEPLQGGNPTGARDMAHGYKDTRHD
eukprot:10191306-Alexandrium_andersonii.AAC.1